MRSLALAVAVLAPTFAFAQSPGHGGGHRPIHQGGHGAGQPGHAMPYAGFQSRDIKALSDQQIADLRAGRGMALALPAELNSYPGPMHVLEHAQALALTPEQAETMRRLMAEMRTRAIAAGERLIVAERALDRLFAEGRADAASLAAAVAEAAHAQGAVRETHLATHIAARAALTPAQIEAYERVRGYR